MRVRILGVAAAVVLLATAAARAQSYYGSTYGGYGSTYGSTGGYRDLNIAEWRRMQRENENRWAESERERLRMERALRSQQRLYEDSLSGRRRY